MRPVGRERNAEAASREATAKAKEAGEAGDPEMGD